MNEIISCLLIAIALSMDTFSLSLGIGSATSIPKNICLKLSIIVGIMHFLMPLIGSIIGSTLINFFSLNSNKLLGIILLFIAINIIIDYIKNETNEINFTYLSMLIFAIGVSIDAFSTGLGLEAITKNKYLALTIFSLTSFTFTILGLLIGKFAKNHLGKPATIIGFLLLLILGMYHLCL